MSRNKTLFEFEEETERRQLFEADPHLFIKRVEIKRREDSEDFGVDVRFYEDIADIWQILSELEEHEEWSTKFIYEDGGWVLKIVMEPVTKEQIYEAAKEEIMERLAARSNRIGWRKETDEGAIYSQ